MPSAPSLVSQTLRKDAGKEKDGLKWFDAVKNDATPEAGFIVTADDARGTFSWMQFNGAVRVIGQNKIILRLGSENAEIQYPDAFPLNEFEECLRTQRLQRIHHKPEQQLMICFVEAEEDDEEP